MKLVEHLTGFFADPHTADLTEVVLDQDDQPYFAICAMEGWADEDGEVPLALRLLDFLPDDTLTIIRQRWHDEGFWRLWSDNEEDGE